MADTAFFIELKRWRNALIMLFPGLWKIFKIFVKKVLTLKSSDDILNKLRRGNEMWQNLENLTAMQPWTIPKTSVKALT